MDPCKAIRYLISPSVWGPEIGVTPEKAVSNPEVNETRRGKLSEILRSEGGYFLGKGVKGVVV